MRNFTCPECQSNRLEEVMSNCTVSTEVFNLRNEMLEYNEKARPTIETDEYEGRFQCLMCGHPIASNVEALQEYLDQQKKSSFY